ncbi:hypothetical protein FHX15_006136 [Rhizobium sp. BK650]|uniref:hypothetical protein n=1 Tax=Rhizobium sp. BK650 TaxID=2586990 RepID=UPI0017E34271|nr:hypothetical protein [Rhizobium sp. BK650]MBB3660864.1 hypothetical protein [Rhizobium sp. BK650]
MKHSTTSAMIVIAATLVIGCSTQEAAITRSGPTPLPGSLTYGGKVVHSRYKPGTIVKNTFLGQFGYRVFERYVVQPDGTLRLTYQTTGPDFLWD